MGIKSTACLAAACAIVGAAEAATVTSSGATITYTTEGPNMKIQVAGVGWFGVTYNGGQYHAVGGKGWHCDGTTAVSSSSISDNKVAHAAATPNLVTPVAGGGVASCAAGFLVPLADFGQQLNWATASGNGAKFQNKHANTGSALIDLAAAGAGAGEPGATGAPGTDVPVGGTPTTTTPPGGQPQNNGGGGGLGTEAMVGIGAGGVVALAAGYTIYSRSGSSSAPPLPGPKPVSPMGGGGMGGMPMAQPQQQSSPWRSTQDPNSGRTYYFNKMTGETSWNPPPGMGGL